MTTAAAEIDTETVVLLPVDQCHRSPTQPRRRGNTDKTDDDFVASIREKGVLQPIVVRSSAEGYEIVFGHRRHQGSIAAGRPTIPAIVRDMSDDDVFDAQLIENVHRNDMHPLDEADGFKRMIDRGRTVQQIADKLGRPASYVAQRLKLCELGKECREAFDKTEISLGVAVVLARVPASLQAEAFKSLNHWQGERFDAVRAKKALEERYLLRLDHAPFDLTDAALVPKAGACAVCPKRTGQQRELFPDAARADMCIDPVCYRGKLDALWKIKKAAAKTGGAPVLEGKEAKDALQGYSSGWRNLDDREWIGGKESKLRTLLGKELPPVTLAHDERTGAIVELARRADVDKLLKKNKGVASRDSGDGDSYREQQRKEAAKDKRRAAAVSLAIDQAIAKVGKLTSDKLISLLVHVLIDRTWNDGQRVVLQRHGLAEKQKGGAYVGAEERLQKYFKTLKKPEQVAGLGLELVLQNLAPSRWGSVEPAWADTLKALGVDFDGIQKQLAAEAKAKKKAKAKPAAKKKPKKA